MFRNIKIYIDEMKLFYTRYCLNNAPFHIFSTIAMMLLIGAFFVPPLSIIDGSVIAAVGEIFAFAALYAVIRAVDKGMDAKIQKGETSLSISKKEKHNEEDEA